MYALNLVCKTLGGVLYICCIFKYVSCLYHLRSPSRETIGDVSIVMWAEKGLSN